MVEEVGSCGEVATATVDVVVGHCACFLVFGEPGFVGGDSGFVHVVPHAVDAFSEEVFVEARPPFADARHGEIGERAVAGPAFALIYSAVGAFNPYVVFGTGFVDEVVFVDLRSGVDHVDCAESFLMQLVVEGLGVGEVLLVEGEDAVSVHVVDVHPYYVAGNLAAAEVVSDFADAVFGTV